MTIETEEHASPALGARSSGPLAASVFVDAASFAVELPTNGSVVIGRDAECDLQIASGSVSRQHARLDMRCERGKIVDLGSRNGTFVNGERLDEGEACDVARGDEIFLGSARLGLVDGSLVPSSTRVLVRSGLLARIDRDLAQKKLLHAVALQLPERWYAHEDVVRWLPTIPRDAYVGMVAEGALVVIGTTPLVGALPPGSVGRVSSERVATGRALVAAALRAASTEPRAERAPGAPIFASPAMKRAHDEAARIANSPVSVLLIGETGVGKEVFARLIHAKSGRGGPMVSVNTAAIPEQLVESELFGHERGAFSGAHAAKIGLVEAAHKGTLFLDEIGDLALPLQAKLLRVLEERAVRPVGATQERRVDVRIVAATHADLERAVATGRFRQDLLFRLNACTLHIPPLRDRREDIETLAREFIARTSPRAALAPETLALLRAYAWPGNVRELRNVVERGVALAGDGATILPEHLPDHVRTPAPTRRASASDAVRAEDIRDALQDYERQRILDALDKTGGNRTEAAKLLGLPRRTLTYKLSKLDIVKR